MRIYLKVLGGLFVLLGLFFLGAGAWLVFLRGSPYYVLAGAALVGSGVLLLREDRRGTQVFLVLWVATLAWSLWEVGLEGWKLMPRLLAPTGLLLAVLVPAGVRALRKAGRHRNAAVVASLALMGVVLAASLSSPTNLGAQAVPASTPVSTPGVEAGHQNWNAYGGTLEGQRYSSLKQITPANVRQLQPAWIQRTGDLPDREEAVTHQREYHSEATPIQVGDTLYTCTPHSFVEAIDALTGRTKWTWRSTADRKGNTYLVCRGVAYFEAPAGTACARRIFAPTFDAKLVALDADTGQPCAGFGKNGVLDLRENMGPSPAAMQISTSPPIVAKGHLIIGERIIDNVAVDEASGVVRAYDAVTGQGLWAWDMGRSENAIAPLIGDAVYTRGTPNVWGAMTADAPNGIVYLPLGNATPDYYIAQRRPFDDRFGSSIVALDIDSGRLRWSRQLVHRDTWDMDLPVGPSLFDLRTPGGSSVPALLQTTKMGQVYLLNRLTGEPLAAVEERAVNTAGGMAGLRYSPTQPFSTGLPSFTPPPPTERDTWGATPIDQLICRIEFRQAHAAGAYAPLGLTPIIGHPAFDGVTDWGGASVDPERGIFVVNTMEMPFRIKLSPRDSDEAQALRKRKSKGGEDARSPSLYEQKGTPYVAIVQAWLGPFGAPCVAPPWGHISAVDLNTRQLLWRKVLGTARDTGLFKTRIGLPLKTGVPNLGGSILTGGGLVFIGATTDQYLRAFDASNGRELWKARLPAGAQATPMSYQGRDGRQYVVITAGGHGALGTRYGDYTMAFALPRATAASGQ